MLVGLLFAQLLLVSRWLKREEGSAMVETSVVRASRPVMEATRTVGSSVAGVADQLHDIRAARDENVQLRREIESLRDEVRRTREAARENERLRKLLEMREELAPQSIGASVVAANLTGQERMILIDRGTDQGVRPDLPVVAWGGAVGRVVFADTNVAKVRLLTDPNGGAAAVVQRSRAHRAQGVVVGRGDGPLAMLYVAAYEDVVEGDRVVTSGKDELFPRGYTIGTVTAIGDEPGASKLISVEPEVHFAALEEVLVLVHPGRLGAGLPGLDITEDQP
jgi:rod shape-determining protein MreC